MTQFIETVLLWITPVIIITYIYIKFYVYNYWKRHGIPYEKPCVPLGNISFSLFRNKIGLGDILTESYEKFKQYAFHGFYVGFQPIIMINDPQLIRTILVKEFASFHSRGWFSNKKLDPLSNNIFLTNDYNDWHHIRSKLTPKFTPAKLKQTFSIIMEKINEVIDFCDAELERNDSVDCRGISNRFFFDITTSVIYRFNGNSLINSNNEIYNMSRRAIEWGNIKMTCATFTPKILELLGMSFYHREVIAFFNGIFKKIVNEERQKPIVRNDIMSTLLEIIEDDTSEKKKVLDTDKSNAGDNHQMSLSDAASHAFLILLAGYDTTSVSMTYCLYELTMNPEIMEKLQNEVDEVAESPSGFTYNSITEMEYLDMVVSETLRKYPPVLYLNRICNKDFLIPESNYTIPKGMRVVISSLGVLHNPEFFPDPKKFDPERYNKQNPDNKRNFVDLTFGEGPRGCIGKRLGLIQMKIILIKLLQNYNIRLKKNLNYVSETNTGTFLQYFKDLILCLEKRKNR